MKFRIRTPSLKKEYLQKKSIKRNVVQNTGIKMSLGNGLVKKSKKQFTTKYTIVYP